MRDPKTDPREGDVLLFEGGAVIVGRVEPDGEVMYGRGDHRYWFLSASDWKTRCATAQVLYAMPD